jgi:hypothetical protein
VRRIKPRLARTNTCADLFDDDGNNALIWSGSGKPIW